MYDGQSLTMLLTEAGFEAPQVKDYLQTAIPKLELVEMSGRVRDGAGVAVEAARP